MNKPFYRRWAPLILAGTLLWLPIMFLGARGALQGQSNDVRQWLPRGFEETRRYDWFLEQFGSEEMAVVSWPGCTLDDERLARMAERLREAQMPSIRDAAGNTYEQSQVFQSVMTGPEALRQLTSPPLELSRSSAMQRLHGTLIGNDGRTTGLIVMVSQSGAQNRHFAVNAIYESARQSANLNPSDLRLGGPTIDSVALDRESQRSRYLLASISVILALFLAWRCLQRVNLVLIVFATALLCGATSVALVHLTGNKMSLVMLTMPTLIYVLAISAAIHLTNYYTDARRHMGSDQAADHAISAGWLPCALTAGTTAIGLGSLAVSEVVPVKMFGLYSALGVLASLPVLFLFLPAALSLWPTKETATRRQTVPPAHPGDLQPDHISWQLASFMKRFYVPILASCLLLMSVTSAGLLRLETSVKLLNLFSPLARIIQDYRWLEHHLGPLVPIEIVLRFDARNGMSMVDRLTLVSDVQHLIRGMDKVDGTMSAATFAADVPRGGGLRQTVKRRLLERELQKQRQGLVDSSYLRDSREGELWRISARVEALNSLDYGQFIEQLRAQVEPWVQQYRNPEQPIETTYTGVVPLVYKAQRELLNDLTRSFVAAFLLVGVVMIVAMRSVRAGLLTMLPNVFPAVLIFGAMGWSGRLCDIGSMMTASVALGIAVDDTIHFLTWFRRAVTSGRSRVEAIAVAYQHCGKAMLQTSIICGLGLLVFSFSSFVPTSRFATLMFVMLLAALIGDLVFLPALLASPLGKWFARSRAETSREAECRLPPSNQLTVWHKHPVHGERCADSPDEPFPRIHPARPNTGRAKRVSRQQPGRSGLA